MNILNRVEWNYTDSKEFDNYVKLFISMSNQMSKDMSIYDYDKHSYDTIQSLKNDVVKQFIPNKAKIFFFFKENTPIGYIFLTPSKYKSIRAIWISEIFIDVQYRHKGYGTILMSDILSYIKEQNYQRVFLTVFEKNTPARALYDKFKFTTFDRVLELGIENLNSIQSIAYLDIGNENLTTISTEALSSFQLVNNFKNVNHLNIVDDLGIKESDRLLDHMKDFKYGMYKKNGIWYIQQPDMLEQTKIGVCHDQSLYIYDRLTKLGIDCRLVYITDSNVTKTHSFVIIKQGNTEIWIESAWAKHRGIHTLKNGHMDVVKLWASSENININDIAVNDNVDTAILLNYKRNLTWGEYLSVVTKPFKVEGSESWSKYPGVKYTNKNTLNAVSVANSDVVLLPNPTLNLHITLEETSVKLKNTNTTNSDAGNEGITGSNRIQVSKLPKNITWYFSTNYDEYNSDWKAFTTNNENWACVSLALAKAYKNTYVDKDKTIKNIRRVDNTIYCYNVVLLRKEDEFSINEDVEVYTINTNQLISLADQLKDLYFIQETPARASVQIWRVNTDYNTLIQRLNNLIGLKYTPIHVEASYKPKSVGTEDIKNSVEIFLLIIEALSSLTSLIKKIHDVFTNIKTNKHISKSNKKITTYKMDDCSKVVNKYIEITDNLKKTDDLETIKQLVKTLPTIKKQYGTLDALGWYSSEAEQIFSLMKTLKIKVDSIYSKYRHNPEKEYNSDLMLYFNKMYRFVEDITIIAQMLIDNTNGNESFITLYKQSLAQYNYLSKLDFNSIATESFGSSIVRFLTGILNILAKIINNIKTSLLSGFKDLKRTELQYYIDENKFSINRILSVRYDLIANLSVPIPLGMISPYKVTTEKINTCINNLDMMNRMVGTLDSINNLVNSLLAGSSITIENNTLNMGELTAIENAFKNESKCFSISKRNSETEFSKVFLSDHCLKDTFTLLDQATKEEYNATKVYAILETIYQKFEQIIALVSSEGATLTKNDLLLLSAQTTTLAKIFDIYGVTMQDLQRVEHNFIFVMKQIKEYSGI